MDCTMEDICVKKSFTIQFENIGYSVLEYGNELKTILRNLSGEFRSGQLSCILGSSGSGKTTFLNLLAGYHEQMTGEFFVNGSPRRHEEFKRYSRYIFQDNQVRYAFTVRELMLTAANLKLHRNTTKHHKLKIIHEILSTLKLTHCEDSRAENLSGGEKKRLAIALELIDNPKILILDEPTTGLDDVATSECIKLLKNIAEQGRTVICSLHCPSQNLLSNFDQVCVMNRGELVYNGDVPMMVPFLQEIGLECPTSYDPADYMIEVCCGEYGDHQEAMLAQVRKYKEKFESGRNTFEFDPDIDIQYSSDDYLYVFFHQLCILTKRISTQLIRDGHLIMKVIVITLLGIFYGLFFHHVGNQAYRGMRNSLFCYYAPVIILFLAVMNNILWFPFELNLLKKELFNNWHELVPYYMALTISTLPIQIIQLICFVTPSYVLADQPMDMETVLLFGFVCLLLSIASESYSMVVSAIFETPLNATFMAKVGMGAFLIIAMYGVGSRSATQDAPIWVRVFLYTDPVRLGFESMVASLLNKKFQVQCPDRMEQCVSDIHYILKSCALEAINLKKRLIALGGFILVFRIIGFCILKQKLSPNMKVKTLTRSLITWLSLGNRQNTGNLRIRNKQKT